MTLKEILNAMLRQFFIIVTGIVFCVAVFCSLFYPKVIFGLEMIWQIILLGMMSTMPQFVFYSKKELGKKQMMIRKCLHILILLIIILTAGYAWGWIYPNDIIQPIVFVLLVMCVYIVVTLLVFQKDKKVAQQLNNELKKYNKEKN